MAKTGCTSKPFREINAVAGSAPEVVLVGLGAIPGAWLRLKVVNHFQPMVPKKHWGTFIVNVMACFARAWCWPSMKPVPPEPALPC